ncbi:hypothetical protein ILUMI_04111 [Ignelater luminosus]|uniref:Uncharacterized protein n=1 Tax=Ignelater luminosus TaxID=2038154 RepID=A0A8K0DEZ2_IGNLU|nr:hypothetical protein ILUMI_04111 [Ignelater luminosus]
MDNDSSDMENCTPPEITKVSKLTTAVLLPSKTVKVYKAAYKFFIEWCKGKKANLFLESVIRKHGGWKSTTVAEGYMDNSIKNKMDTAEKLFSRFKITPLQKHQMRI